MSCLLTVMNVALTAFSGAYYFLGGIAMNIAGIGEFILGNSTCPVSIPDFFLPEYN